VNTSTLLLDRLRDIIRDCNRDLVEINKKEKNEKKRFEKGRDRICRAYAQIKDEL
jgi:hypothetical protein